MLRLYVEEERNERAFEALTRFLTAVDAIPAGLRGRGGLDPLALAFQLKLLWLSGYVPHLDGCVECGEEDGLVGYLPSAGGAVCAACAPSRDRRALTRGLPWHPGAPLEPARGRARARAGGACGSGCARRRRRVVRVPRRLPPPHVVRVKRELGDGYELDDDPARIDREAVHRYLSEESYWARGRSREVQDALIDGAARVVGLYHDGRQVGFSRTLSDGHAQSYLADVYVLEEHRGRGLGVELVRFSVDEGPLAATSGSCTPRTRTTCTASRVRQPGTERSSARARRARGLT